MRNYFDERRRFTLLPDILPRLWNFALRITGDRQDAEDLVQRACVRALERPHQLQPGTSALSWMFSIVHTTWINELRARSVESVLFGGVARAGRHSGAF